MELQSLFQYPIIQGPMAGGANTPAMIAAVSNAGGLGSLAASLLTPAAIEQQVTRIRDLTGKPFLLNFFVQDTPAPGTDELERAARLLQPVVNALGWTELPMPRQWCEDFSVQFETLLALRPAAASFTFNILGASQVERLHAANIVVIGTATTVDEALAWQAAGADAVIASGIESGGHRGTFIGTQEAASLGGHQLWPLVAEAVRIPVIAAGAIMDGADIRRALDAGATAVQMGTAFIVCDESGIHPAYKQRLLTAGDHPTRLTRSISGRYARGLENRFMHLMQDGESQVPPYPVQNALTTGIRAAAAAKGDTELMSLWAGTGVGRVRPMPAARLVEQLMAELQATYT